MPTNNNFAFLLLLSYFPVTEEPPLEDFVQHEFPEFKLKVYIQFDRS
jgi:hypothetical protein